MPDPREDVLHKMEALLKKHQATQPDIPVLTDIVEHPRIDLNMIPVLTEEVRVAAESYGAPRPIPSTDSAPVAPHVGQELPLESLPLMPDNLDLAHPSGTPEASPPQADATSVLQRLEAVEAEVQAEIEARINQTQAAHSLRPSIEIPPDASFISLSTVKTVDPIVPVHAAEPAHFPQDNTPQIAAMIEADVSRLIKKHLHQALDEELSGMLANALDKAISSMLEQFMVHMEEVVRHSIADELTKQLAPFKRPVPPPKP